jgi:hypothetical protein
LPSNNTPRSKRKEWWEIPNTVAIYAFAAGLFILLILSSISWTGVTIGYNQLMIIGLIVVLLLFRYFSEIKLGKLLELRKTIEDVQIRQNEFRESTAEKMMEIKEQKSHAMSSEKVYRDTTMPYEQKEQLALRLLEDPSYKWRNRKTILRKTGMTDSEFEEFLTAHPEVVLATLPDEYGNQLYGLKDRVENYGS